MRLSDWIGPREELVPIGPTARAGASEQITAEEPVPPTADAFWSEDSAALHDAVQAPAAGAPPSSVSVAGGRRHERRWPSPAVTGLGRGVRGWRPPRLVAGAVGVGLLVLALIGTVEGAPGSGSRRSSASLSALALDHSGGSAGARGAGAAVTGGNAAERNGTATAPPATAVAGAERSGVHVRTTARTAPADRRRGRRTGASGAAAELRHRATHPARRHIPAMTHGTTHAVTTTPSPAQPTYAATPTPAATGTPATTAPATPSTGTAATTARSTGSSSSHPFGPNGTLGPGSSPDS